MLDISSITTSEKLEDFPESFHKRKNLFYCDGPIVIECEGEGRNKNNRFILQYIFEDSEDIERWCLFQVTSEDIVDIISEATHINYVLDYGKFEDVYIFDVDVYNNNEILAIWKINKNYFPQEYRY